MKTQDCHCCDGSGKEIDSKAMGTELRKLRLSRGLSMEVVGLKIGYSVPYLSDLERGRRNWSAVMIDKYRKACV